MGRHFVSWAQRYSSQPLLTKPEVKEAVCSSLTYILWYGTVPLQNVSVRGGGVSFSCKLQWKHRQGRKELDSSLSPLQFVQ